MNFAICDDYHIHERNFPSLIKYINKSEKKIDVLIQKNSEEWKLINANGRYDFDFSTISFRKELFERFKVSEFIDYKYREFSISSIAISEALTFCLPRPHWQRKHIINDHKIIIKKMFTQDRETLIGCFAAATFWIDYWMDRRREIFLYDAIFIFSGSYIYSRSLLEILRKSNVKAFVLESFMTGDDFYIEERYTPIANSSNIQYTNYRNLLLRQKQTGENFDVAWEKEKIRSFNKLLNIKNKNVQQPARDCLPLSMKNKKIALILGQVANDYSIIDGGGYNINSIPSYRAIIKHILNNTDMNIIFKCHPWERKKANIGRAFTRDLLQSYVSRLPVEMSKRVIIVEHKNIGMLFEQCHAVFTICSQSAIEAAFQGFKPITLGHPFYGKAGFTSDFSSARAAVTALASGKIDPLLTIDEFGEFSNFMSILLRRHLFHATESGEARFNEFFKDFVAVPHQKTQRKEVEISATWK